MIKWIYSIIRYFFTRSIDNMYLEEAFQKNKKNEWRHDA